MFVNHVFGLIFDDLRVWEYQNRIQRIFLHRIQCANVDFDDFEKKKIENVGK